VLAPLPGCGRRGKERGLTENTPHPDRHAEPSYAPSGLGVFWNRYPGLKPRAPFLRAFGAVAVALRGLMSSPPPSGG
jgi:hypothetical protein